MKLCSIVITTTTWPYINIPVATQSQSESDTNKNMAVYDHRLSLVENAIERIGYTHKAYAA